MTHSITMTCTRLVLALAIGTTTLVTGGAANAGGYEGGDVRGPSSGTADPGPSPTRPTGGEAPGCPWRAC